MTDDQFIAQIEKDPRYSVYWITIIDTKSGQYRSVQAAGTLTQAESTAKHEVDWLNRE